MKAVVIRAHGGLDTLRLEELPIPRPEPGQVLVHVRAVALNNLDVWARSGPPGGRPVYPWGRLALPLITGGDVAGLVEAVGPGATDLAPGDRVVVNPILSCGQCAWCLAGEQSMCTDYRIYGEHIPGGMAEYTVVPAANLLRVPDDVSLEHAAAAPVCFTTAWGGLMTAARLRAGEDLFVVGASGGVGTAALQIGRLARARVLALVGRAGKAGEDAGPGAEADDRLTQPQFSAQVREITGSGVHVAIDPVGAATWPETIRSLRPGGRMAICGATGGERPDIDIPEVYQRRRPHPGAPTGRLPAFLLGVGLGFAGALGSVGHRALAPAGEVEARRLL